MDQKSGEPPASPEATAHQKTSQSKTTPGQPPLNPEESVPALSIPKPKDGAAKAEIPRAAEAWIAQIQAIGAQAGYGDEALLNHLRSTKVIEEGEPLSEERVTDALTKLGLEVSEALGHPVVRRHVADNLWLTVPPGRRRKGSSRVEVVLTAVCEGKAQRLHGDKIDIKESKARERFAREGDSARRRVNESADASAPAIARALVDLSTTVEAATTEWEAEQKKKAERRSVTEYVCDIGRGMSRIFYDSEGEPRSERLTNFTAKIVADTLLDDGLETRRLFKVEAIVAGRTMTREFPAPEFERMNWVTDKFGADANILVGPSFREHVRAAIQSLSDDKEQRVVYTHTGWRQLDGQWAYLHGGGAIGAPGMNVMTSLTGALERFKLPTPPEGDALRRAVRESLNMLKVAPERITIPLFASIWRAILGAADFSIMLVGTTGGYKSELAALGQQHFGPEMIREKLPGTWSSTENASEELAFLAKDALLTVDDFAPNGSERDRDDLHKKAERLIRGQGNSAGRQRMRADTTLRAPRNPRGLLLTTGEDVPRGQSIRARLVILNVQKGDVTEKKLDECQAAAASGAYAQTTAAFIAWLAPRYERVRKQLNAMVAEVRADASRAEQHRRVSTNVANLFVGIRSFARFAEETGALNGDESKALLDRARSTLFEEVSAAQGEHQTSSEPTACFLRAIASAFASGRAHVTDEKGRQPESPERWGWRGADLLSTNHKQGEDPVVVATQTQWRPLGERIGWLAEGELYLDADAAMAVAQRVCRDRGEPLVISLAMLKKELKEKGHLKDWDRHFETTPDGSKRFRERAEKRATLEGVRRWVLHPHVESIYSGSRAGAAAPPANENRSDPTTGQASIWSELAPLAPVGPEKEGRPNETS